MKKPAKIPGEIKGMMTRDSNCRVVAPRSWAASSMEVDISRNRGSTIRTTMGISKAMWLIRTEPKPNGILSIVKKIRKLAPMMTSGETIRTLFRVSSDSRVTRLVVG